MLFPYKNARLIGYIYSFKAVEAVDKQFQHPLKLPFFPKMLIFQNLVGLRCNIFQKP